MKKFLVVIGTKQADRLRFEVMAPSAAAAWDQHIDLVQPGERIEVEAI